MFDRRLKILPHREQRGMSTRTMAILIVALVILCFIGLAGADVLIKWDQSEAIVTVQQTTKGYQVMPKCPSGKAPSTTVTADPINGTQIITVICPRRPK
jgi:hypothetical protein